MLVAIKNRNSLKIMVNKNPVKKLPDSIFLYNLKSELPATVVISTGLNVLFMYFVKDEL